MTIDLAERLRSARDWLSQDPDPRTSAELSALIHDVERAVPGAADELADAFAGSLGFGTAGIRGRMGPGSNRMNRVTVTRAAAGVAAHLRVTGGHSAVVGFDARRDSDVFARDIAEVLAGAGIATMVFPRPCPTPVLAFAIRSLGTACGLMVTASHNPAGDNGVKVYLGDGRQIVPPVDAEISACIAAVGDIRDIARSDDVLTLDDTVRSAYLERLRALMPAGPRDVRVAYTPLHGVGGDVFLDAVRQAGFPQPAVVAAQSAPDPGFPTVAYPNPEEPGAMDLGLELARGSNADLLIAHDPDADRCAAGFDPGGGWRMLTGDEIGALLAWWVVQRTRREGGVASGAMAASMVSDTLVRAIAEEAGFGYDQTLTGFKWISRVPDLVFGYEEALGYCVDPPAVADKDGISAALLLMEAVAWLRARGSGIGDVLDDLARRFGVHATDQVSVRVEHPSQVARILDRIRRHPPASLGPVEVIGVDDLRDGVDGLPPTDGIRLRADGARVIIRPSGTEPKLKCYLQAVEPVTGPLPEARARAARTLGALRTATDALIAAP